MKPQRPKSCGAVPCKLLRLGLLSLDDPGVDSGSHRCDIECESVPLLSKAMRCQVLGTSKPPRIVKPLKPTMPAHHLLTKRPVKPTVRIQSQASTLPQQFQFTFTMPMPGAKVTKCSATLLDLPTEVRIEIYKEVFRGRAISIKDPCFIPPGGGSPYRGVILNLLFVNRTIRVEALEVLLQTAVFAIPNLQSAKYLVEKLGKSNTNMIRKMLIPILNMIGELESGFSIHPGICDRYVHAEGLKAFQPEFLLVCKNFDKLCLDSSLRLGRTGVGVIAEMVTEDELMKPNTVRKLRMYGVYALVKKNSEVGRARRTECQSTILSANS